MSEPSDEYVIVTCGDFVHRMVALLDDIHEEHRLRVDEDGLSVTTTNPENTVSVDMSAPGSAFDGYNHLGGAVSLNVDAFGKRINTARKGRGGYPNDPVVVKGSSGYTSVKVDRADDYSHQSGYHTPEPDSLRASPDLPEDLDMPWTAHNVDVGSLAEIATRMDDIGHKHVGIGAEPRDLSEDSSDHLDDRAVGDLYLYAKDGDVDAVDADDEFRFTTVCEAEAGEDEAMSLVSVDYLEEIATSLKSAQFGTVDIDIGTEVPVAFRFHDGEYGIEGRYMIAPRLSDDDGTSLGEWRQPTWEA